MSELVRRWGGAEEPDDVTRAVALRDVINDSSRKSVFGMSQCRTLAAKLTSNLLSLSHQPHAVFSVSNRQTHIRRQTPVICFFRSKSLAVFRSLLSLLFRRSFVLSCVVFFARVSGISSDCLGDIITNSFFSSSLVFILFSAACFLHCIAKQYALLSIETWVGWRERTRNSFHSRQLTSQQWVGLRMRR